MVCAINELFAQFSGFGISLYLYLICGKNDFREDCFTQMLVPVLSVQYVSRWKHLKLFTVWYPAHVQLLPETLQSGEWIGRGTVWGGVHAFR